MAAVMLADGREEDCLILVACLLTSCCLIFFHICMHRMRGIRIFQTERTYPMKQGYSCTSCTDLLWTIGCEIMDTIQLSHESVAL
jgi:hypothetical protein